MANFHKFHDMSINKEDIKQCIIDLKAECIFKKNNDPIFIIDNARINHYDKITEIIKNLFSFFYLPSYPSFLNHVENLITKWKFSYKITSTKWRGIEKKIKFNEIDESDCDVFNPKYELFQKIRKENEIHEF